MVMLSLWGLSGFGIWRSQWNVGMKESNLMQLGQSFQALMQSAVDATYTDPFF
jgi:hypothetical protein